MKSQQKQLDELQMELERGFSSLSSSDNILHKEAIAIGTSTPVVAEVGLDILPQIYTVSPTRIVEVEERNDEEDNQEGQMMGGAGNQNNDDDRPLEFASEDDDDEYSFSL